MQDEYDFQNAKRGAVVTSPAGKTRITIRLDDDFLEWFRQAVNEQALRRHMEYGAEPLEQVLRRIVREE